MTPTTVQKLNMAIKTWRCKQLNVEKQLMFARRVSSAHSSHSSPVFTLQVGHKQAIMPDMISLYLSPSHRLGAPLPLAVNEGGSGEESEV